MGQSTCILSDKQWPLFLYSFHKFFEIYSIEVRTIYPKSGIGMDDAANITESFKQNSIHHKFNIINNLKQISYRHDCRWWRVKLFIIKWKPCTFWWYIIRIGCIHHNITICLIVYNIFYELIRILTEETHNILQYVRV